MDNKRNYMDQLKALDQLAGEMEGYSDALESMPRMDDMMGMPQMGDMFGEMPGMSGMPGMPGGPKDIMIYDTVVVHGLNGDYKISFEETEEGLAINVIK